MNNGLKNFFVWLTNCTILAAVGSLTTPRNSLCALSRIVFSESLNLPSLLPPLVPRLDDAVIDPADDDDAANSCRRFAISASRVAIGGASGRGPTTKYCGLSWFILVGASSDSSRSNATSGLVALCNGRWSSGCVFPIVPVVSDDGFWSWLPALGLPPILPVGRRGPPGFLLLGEHVPEHRITAKTNTVKAVLLVVHLRMVGCLVDEWTKLKYWQGQYKLAYILIMLPCLFSLIRKPGDGGWGSYPGLISTIVTFCVNCNGRTNTWNKEGKDRGRGRQGERGLTDEDLIQKYRLL